MSGDTGHLQRLTDEQVKARIASYGDDGRFEASLRELWNDAGPVIEAAVRTHFGEDAGCLNARHFTLPVDESWVRSVAEQGLKMFAAKRSVPEFTAARARMVKDVIRGFDDCFAGRADDRVSAIDTFHRMMSFSLSSSSPKSPCSKPMTPPTSAAARASSSSAASPTWSRSEERRVGKACRSRG